MSQNLKRLQKIEAALEQLLAKDKAYLLFYDGNDPEKELQWYIDAGRYDPARKPLELPLNVILCSVILVIGTLCSPGLINTILLSMSI